MGTLTEEMVIARAKESNIAAITKLNCWGSELSDVSIIRRMTNVTVLSLSVNNITTLVDFQYCRKLQELFVRKNFIKNLNEVCYLQDLVHLKALWLDENPCASVEDYRYSVIKALPQLKKLDNVSIESEELDRAKKYGKRLVHPEEEGEYYLEPEEEEYVPGYANDEEEKCPSVGEEIVVMTDEDPSKYNQDYQYQKDREFNYKNSSPAYQFNNDKIETVPENDTSSKMYRYENRQETPRTAQTPQYNSIPRSRTQPCVQSDGDFNYNNDWKRRGCSGSTCCIQQPNPKRPNERRTNVLNAVLCLIKELDYPNLEVVQMAVKCRMEELSDEM